MKNIIAVSLLFIFSYQLQAGALPGDFNATYSLEKYGTTIAEMKLSLRQQNNNITYQSRTTTSGMLSLFNKDRVDEVSQLLWNADTDHAILQNYKFTRKSKSKKNQHFTLNHDAQNGSTAKGTYAGKSFNVETAGASWDRLSVQLALASELNSTKEMQQQYSYNVIDKGKLVNYHFNIMENETIRINDKQYPTIKIKRVHDTGQRETYFWVSKDLDFLPVKIEQYKKGKLHLSMFLNKFTKLN